jgi:hypothetical protein
MKRKLQTLIHWFMVNWLCQTEVAETQVPYDPLNTGSTRLLTNPVKGVILLLFTIFSIMPIFAQSPENNLEGLWILRELQGNDTARVLTPAEIEKSIKNGLHDFPLTTTSLKFSGNNFTMTHHTGGVMGGTFDVQKNVLTLHVSSCSTCGSKDFIFIIRKQTPTEFLLDMFEEDEGSTSYVRLTFERNTIVNNVNQK